jgi:hypothetical protein
MTDSSEGGLSRRDFVQGAVSGVVLVAAPAAVLAQIPKMHTENLKRLQDWSG